MIDLMKKAMFTGIGLASITKDKIDELAKEFIQQGNLSEQEGRKLVQEMVDYSEKSRKDLEEQTQFYVKKTLEQLNLTTQKEVEELREIITGLKHRLDELEKGK